MKIIATIVLAISLTSCIVVPIPPKGDNIGMFGRLQIGISYFPPEPKLEWFKQTTPTLNLNNIKKEDDMDWFNPVVPKIKIL